MKTMLKIMQIINETNSSDCNTQSECINDAQISTIESISNWQQVIATTINTQLLKDMFLKFLSRFVIPFSYRDTLWREVMN